MEPGAFPAGFFDREPAARLPEAGLDAAAVEALRDLYDDLEIDGRVLDLCASPAAHFNVPPDELVVHRLADDGRLPFGDAGFDHALLCEGVGMLVRPLEAFAEIARVLRPGGLLVCTFSNRPGGAIRGWAATDDAGRVRIVRRYFALTPGFGAAQSDLRASLKGGGDRLWATWATRSAPAAA
jgi:SAM-dependent methyltransferase